MKIFIKYQDKNNILKMVKAGDFEKLILFKIANKYLFYIKFTAKQNIGSR